MVEFRNPNLTEDRRWPPLSYTTPWDTTTGSGLYADDLTWADDPDLALAALRRAIDEGVDPAPDPAGIARLRDERLRFYLGLIDTPDEAARFSSSYALALTVAPYLEDHNFYVEHWFQGVFWRQMRRLGQTLTELGQIAHAEDIFLFTRWEIGPLLFAAIGGWLNSTGAHRGTASLRTVEERRAILAKLDDWTPPPAIGRVPERITDPVVAMLWGISDRMLADWRRLEAPSLSGIGASGGVAEGPVVIVRSSIDLERIKPGNIVICRSLVPAWTADFSRAAGVVSEIGGILSHGAICCREWGVPAVASVPGAMTAFTEGCVLRVDGTLGSISQI